MNNNEKVNYDTDMQYIRSAFIHKSTSAMHNLTKNFDNFINIPNRFF